MVAGVYGAHASYRHSAPGVEYGFWNVVWLSRLTPHRSGQRLAAGGPGGGPGELGGRLFWTAGASVSGSLDGRLQCTGPVVGLFVADTVGLSAALGIALGTAGCRCRIAQLD